MLNQTLTFSRQNNMKVVSKFHVGEEELLHDRSCIHAAKADPAKFETLYSKYYEQVLKFVFQRMDCKDTAFDITQQVFLKAMQNLHRYEYRGLPFSAWLYRIAINEMNMLFRKNKKEQALNVDVASIDEMMGEMEEDPVEEKIKIVLNAVSKLDKEDLLIIEMRFFEKRAFKEIGDILSITENNAKVRTYRILDRLKQIITKQKRGG